MRQTILTLLAASAAIAVYAHPISQGEAKSIASEFFNSGSGPRRAPKAVTMTDAGSKPEDAQPYYIFNADNGNGFVIVSGDSRAKRILGYSDKGSFSKENIPPQLEWLLSEYSKNMESLPTNAPSPRQNISRSDEHSYLLKTQWGQGDPYNAKCPYVNGGRAVTGCVATAMAQIINYENKTSHVSEIPEYTCSVYMPALPAYEFDYGNLDNDGIATLMLYCGQSVRMDYGPVESGSTPMDVPDALRNYFGWEPEVRVLDRDNYNDEHWNRMVKEEISKGHPLLYSAVGEQGWHAFVVDGFADDLFHVNWGWNGNLDGYYSFQPFGQEHKSDFINMQWMVAVRDDDPSSDIITYGTTIDGVNYELTDDLSAMVLPLKDGKKYSGDLVIPSHVDFEGKTYTVNYFGPRAFVNCEHLESISIPATIIGQEWSIFEGCENLHKVNVEDMAAFIRLEVGGWPTGSPFYYGAYLYLNGELVKDLVIPEGIEKVGYCKFRNCWSIESVIMSSTMKEAYLYSFANCPKLKHIDMSQSSMEIIGDMAFVNSVSLEDVNIPATVKTIESTAFGQENGPGCKNLRKIVSLATTPPWCTSDVIFQEKHHSDAIVYVPDTSLEEYRQSKEWNKFLDIRPLSEEKPLAETDTIVFDNLKYELDLSNNIAAVIGTRDPDIWHSVTIPAAVENQGKSYPVTRIAYSALHYIHDINCEAPIEKIGISSFSWTTFKDCFELPATLKQIPRKAFEGSRINHIILPKELSSIGSRAFGHRYEDADGNLCYESGVTEIEIRNPNPPEICEDTFNPLIYAETILKVPYGTKKAYASAPGWCNFSNIVNLDEEQEQTHNNDLTLSANLIDDSAVRNGMPLKITATVRNSGEKEVSGFKLSWHIDGKPIGEKHYDMDLQPSEIISLEEKIIASVETAGMHELTLTISAEGVDDQDISDNEVVLPFESFDKGYYRVSLFEEFTSESCSFTTLFAPQIEDAIQNSGKSDFLAKVTHHCGFIDDFLTLSHDYEWFYNDNGMTFTPALMLNRTDIDETGYTPLYTVPNDLDRRIVKQAGICDALISVYCEVKDDKVTVKTLLEKDEDFNLNEGFDYLTVYLLEDSIPSREQIDTWSDGYAEDYIHRNTLRKILTRTWGNRIEWNDDICALKFTSDIDSEWNKDNLKAVAFIHRYNPESPVGCQVYTANSSDLPQYGIQLDESEYKEVAPFVESISLSPNTKECASGESFKIEATIVPEKLSDVDISWKSSDEKVVTVDTEGNVTAVGSGEATITATVMDGYYLSSSCLVIVYSVPAESISIDNEVFSGHVGDNLILKATVQPENTTDKTITWSSSDENIAQISTYDDATYVEIVGVGKVDISASCGYLNVSFTLYCYPKVGDADWNGAITVTDAVDIANYVVEKKSIPVDWDIYEWRQFYIMGANVNGSPDNSITFADAYATVSLALEQPVHSAPQQISGTSSRRMEGCSEALVVGDIYEKSRGVFVVPVTLDNSIEYVALQADIILSDGMTIESVNSGNRIADTHTLTTRSIDDYSMRVAIFDAGNSTFINSKETILEIVARAKSMSSDDITIRNVIASDKEANEYILTSIDSSTGVWMMQDNNICITQKANGIHLHNAASKTVVIATLDGSIIKSFVPETDSEDIALASGIYIVKVDDTFVKCVVR